MKIEKGKGNRKKKRKHNEEKKRQNKYKKEEEKKRYKGKNDHRPVLGLRQA